MRSRSKVFLVVLALAAFWALLVLTRPAVPAQGEPGCIGRHCGSDLCFGHRTTQFTGPGSQVLVGTAKRDVLNSGRGNDVIVGKGGNDILCGGPGNDVIVPGPGHDFTLAGDGHDICVAVRIERKHGNVFGCDEPR